jgi:hypothetical protein
MVGKSRYQTDRSYQFISLKEYFSSLWFLHSCQISYLFQHQCPSCGNKAFAKSVSPYHFLVIAAITYGVNEKNHDGYPRQIRLTETKASSHKR